MLPLMSGDGHAYPTRRRARPIRGLRERRVYLDIARYQQPLVIGDDARYWKDRNRICAADRLRELFHGLSRHRREDVHLIKVVAAWLAAVGRFEPERHGDLRLVSVSGSELPDSRAARHR